jgi:hypothetical protein
MSSIGAAGVGGTVDCGLYEDELEDGLEEEPKLSAPARVA